MAKDGSPDYRKHFCCAACLKVDKRERLQAKRTRLEGRRCPHCGRKSGHAVMPLLPARIQESERNAVTAV